MTLDPTDYASDSEGGVQPCTRDNAERFPVDTVDNMAQEEEENETISNKGNKEGHAKKAGKEKPPESERTSSGKSKRDRPVSPLTRIVFGFCCFFCTMAADRVPVTA